jgi:hypothetical protein
LKTEKREIKPVCPHCETEVDRLIEVKEGWFADKRVHILLPALAALTVLIASCSSDLEGLSLDGPFTLAEISVLVHNSTGAEITVIYDGLNKATIAYGSSRRIRGISDMSPLERTYTFDVAPAGVALARVSYRVLKFPKRIKDQLVSQEVKMVVKQPSPGIFSAATVDTLWIQVLGTTALPSSDI